MIVPVSMPLTCWNVADQRLCQPEPSVVVLDVGSSDSRADPKLAPSGVHPKVTAKRQSPDAPLRGVR